NHHRVEQRGRGVMGQRDEQGEAQREPEAGGTPSPFSPQAVREMPERNLTGNAGKAYEPERPCRLGGAEAGLNQIARLMHLDGVPGIERAEVAERDPPEAPGGEGAQEGPIGAGPEWIDNVRGRVRCRRVRGLRRAVRVEAEVFGALAHEEA